MKDEEFNNFLRERADSFELKPSSGSFAAVQRKMQHKSKRRGIIIFFSLLASTLVGAYFIISAEKIGNTHSTAINAPNQVETESNGTITQSQAYNAYRNRGDEKAYHNQNNTVDNSVAAASVNSLAAIAATPSAQGVKQQKKQQSAPKSVTATTLNTGNSQNEGVLDADKTEDYSIAENILEATASNNDNNIDNNINEGIETEEDAPTQETVITKIDEPNPKNAETTDSILKKCNCVDSKWALKAYYNPFTAVYLNLANKKEDISSSSIATSDVEEYAEELKAGWSLGLKAERALNTKWKIGFGIAYNKWSIDQVRWNINYTKDSTETYGFDSLSNQSIVTGYTVYSLPTVKDSTKVNLSLQSIHLPVYANYTFATNKRWQFGVNGGFTASYIVAGKYTELYAKQPPSNRDNLMSSGNTWQTYRRFNVNVALGFAINYKISNCTSVFAEQTISAPLLTIQSKNAQVPARRPLFIGVETGVKINF